MIITDMDTILFFMFMFMGFVNVMFSWYIAKKLVRQWEMIGDLESSCTALSKRLCNAEGELLALKEVTRRHSDKLINGKVYAL